VCNTDLPFPATLAFFRFQMVMQSKSMRNQNSSIQLGIENEWDQCKE
jgi:hypothetical protein